MASLVQYLAKEFKANSNKEDATAMEAYMRNLFPFFGIKSTPRRDILASALRVCGRPEDVVDTANELYALPQREYHHTACDLLVWSATRELHLDHIPAIEQLICRNSWWDTVDTLAPKVIGSILRKQTEAVVRKYCETWIESDNIWLQRSAIVLQLHWKKDTRDAILFDMIARRAHSKEFFVQKGAGWALREYGKYNPHGVGDFVRDNEGILSALTKREGMRRILGSEL